MLEQKIEALTAAVVANTAALQALAGNPGAVAMAAAATPTMQAPPAAAPSFTPPAAAAPAMPPAPSFAPQAPQAAPASRFADNPSLTAWTMQVYQAEPAKMGPRIEAILKQFGVGNISDIQPAQFEAFAQMIEQAKAAA